MKLDRRGLLTALSGGAVFLGAYGGARAVLQARREGQYRLGRLKNGPELAMTALDKEIDVNLEYALWLTARELAPQWLPALKAGRPKKGG